MFGNSSVVALVLVAMDSLIPCVVARAWMMDQGERIVLVLLAACKRQVKGDWLGLGWSITVHLLKVT